LSKRIFHIVLLCFTLLVWAGYGCGALVTYLPSPAPWWLDVAGLAFPYMFFLMLICIVIWLTRRWQLALISVCILLCGWKGIIHTWGWHWRNEAVSAEEGFTLMSFNVNDFKSMASSWQHWREDFDHILYFHNADIICLQEFATTDLYSQDEKNNVLHYTTLLQKPYAYFTNDFQWHTPYGYTWYFGNIILSKFPFVDTGKLFLDHRHHISIAYADVRIGTDTVRIITTHLQSFGLEEAEVQGLKDPNPEVSRRLLYKLRKGYQLREHQAVMAARLVRESPHPVIVCGDLNTTPVSATYFTVRGHLQDAFLKKGAGLGRTYTRYAPTLRIDYIFVDPRLDVKGFEVLHIRASDHYPVMAGIDQRSDGS